MIKARSYQKIFGTAPVGFAAQISAMSKFAKFRGLLFLTLYLAFILPWIKGVEYFWEPDALTWEECRRRCVGLRGDVVSLHTKEEYNEAILFLNSKR